MHCRQAEERLQSLLDARRPFTADRELSQHLAVCPSCQERASAYEQLAHCFAGPRSRSVRAFAKRSPAGRGWSRYPLPAALAAAVAGLALWMPQRLEQAGPQLAQHETPAAVPGAAAARTGAMTAQNRDPLTDAALTHLAALGPMSIAVLNLEPPTPQWVQPVSGGFRPVTRSVEAAFGAMRDTMLWAEPTTRS
jgi:hypothetical protein